MHELRLIEPMGTSVTHVFVYSTNKQKKNAIIQINSSCNWIHIELLFLFKIM